MLIGRAPRTDTDLPGRQRTCGQRPDPRVGSAADRGSVRASYVDALEHRVSLVVDPAHVASARVLEKLGMTRVGIVEYEGEETTKYVLRASELPA